MRKLKVAGVGFLVGSIFGAAVDYRYSILRNSKPSSPEDKTKEKLQHQILKYGVPSRSPPISHYDSHVLCYDQEKRIPRWVAEHITKEQLSGNANRKHSKFRSDSEISEKFRSENSDFYKSGWSRGHMAPAGDFKSQQKSMDDTFLLSNILPQDFQNNAGFWNRFEIYCRGLAKQYEEVRVISGPVMMASTDEDGKKFIKYQVIGQNQVAVPTHLYKVIVAEKGGSESPVLGAFIVPNKPIDYTHPLAEYQVNLTEVEKETGLSFLPKLDRSRTRDLCSVDGCKLMARNEYELFFITRRMMTAPNLVRLQKAWDEIRSKNLTPDDTARQVYEERKQALNADIDSFKKY